MPDPDRPEARWAAVGSSAHPSWRVIMAIPAGLVTIGSPPTSPRAGRAPANYEARRLERSAGSASRPAERAGAEPEAYDRSPDDLRIVVPEHVKNFVAERSALDSGYLSGPRPSRRLGARCARLAQQSRNEKRGARPRSFVSVAERVGFEPTNTLRCYLTSNQAPSTARPSLRRGG